MSKLSCCGQRPPAAACSVTSVTSSKQDILCLYKQTTHTHLTHLLAHVVIVVEKKNVVTLPALNRSSVSRADGERRVGRYR